MRKVLYLLGLLVLMGCGKQEKWEIALERAGKNKGELMKVLAFYAQDSCKLKAAEYLIAHMPYHFEVEEYMVSPQGANYYPDIMRFDGAEAVKRHCDSLLAAGYRIQRTHKYDLECVRADYLIRQIELAFEAWEKPWAREVTWNDFCRYILPYRSQNESLTDVRKVLYDRYVPLLDSANVKTAFEACNVLNELLKKEIAYAETGNPLGATVEETMRSGRGTCEALCNYTVLAMRAAGIPVAVHQTVWTHMDRGHVWPAVKSEGRFYDFSPGDVHADAYQKKLQASRYLRPAKVYRRNYECVQTYSGPDDGYVTFLKNPLLEDATDGLLDAVYTLRVPMDEKYGSEEGNFVYLCAFNYYNWQPVALGREDGRGNAVFEKVAGRNIFLLAKAQAGGTLQEVSAPFCTDAAGNVRFLSADTTRMGTFTFRKNEREIPYLLSYWERTEGRFVEIACASQTDTTATYTNIPADALLFYRIGKRVLGNRVGFIDRDSVYKNSAAW